jgi:phenylacetate-CoA ligase
VISELQSVQVPWYCTSIDFAALAKDLPPPPDFFRSVFVASRDEIRAIQERKFRTVMEIGWTIPFYQRHWGQAGIEPGDIKSLEDIRHLPPFTVHDVRASIERKPPFGDFMAIGPQDGRHMPLVFHTSGGTTGLPRPMFYSPRDRESMAILGARRMLAHGIRPGDLVLCTYATGLANGGFGVRDAIWKYTGAVPVMTGTGATTPTRRQLELVKAWGVKVILAFPSYLRHMAAVSRDELGFDPRDYGVRLIGTHLGPETPDSLEELWGAPCLDAYGTSESGMMAFESEYRSGMHIQEDAVFLEIADPETGAIVPDGERGTIYITTLFRDGAPQIRFNVNDIAAIRKDACPSGSSLRRLACIYGRNDNMVKLRGINVFPEAVGVVVLADTRSNGEYVCIVDQSGPNGSDEMTVRVERADRTVDADALKHSLTERLKDVLGVRITVSVVDHGALSSQTGVASSFKAKRLVDKRPKSP